MKPTVTIDRATWRRGGSDSTPTDGLTQLLNEYDRMCCLGFHAVQLCGSSEDDIRGIEEPRQVSGEPLTGLVEEDGEQTTFTVRAMGINDNEHYGDERREMELIKLADEHGFKYVFTG